MEIVTSIGGELWHGQAQNGVNFNFGVQYEGQQQLSHKTIGILTKLFCTSGSNVVILAWTLDELSHGQTWWRTDGQGQRQYPEAKTGLG